jgi:AcrR family transcriptional regulator
MGREAVKKTNKLNNLERRQQPSSGAAHRKSSRLSREDWINAARTMLVESGIDGVKVDLLAKRINVTRGSFYWHFEDRDALLDALLHLWEASNTEPMLAAIKAAGAKGDRNDFDQTVGRLWIDETDFDPAFDSAIRDWARTDPIVAQAVHRIDDIRVAAFAEMFKSYGFDEDEAEVRGRITYYHQVGYYTLGIRESTEERGRLATLYDKVLLY